MSRAKRTRKAKSAKRRARPRAVTLSGVSLASLVGMYAEHFIAGLRGGTESPLADEIDLVRYECPRCGASWWAPAGADQRECFACMAPLLGPGPPEGSG